MNDHRESMCMVDRNISLSIGIIFMALALVFISIYSYLLSDIRVTNVHKEIFVI